MNWATRGRTATGPTEKAGQEVASVPLGVVKFGPNVPLADRDKVLAASVGFVVAGMTVISPDGEQYDLAESTGTGFVVSPDGYLITNRHVVESVASLQRSPLRIEYQKEKMVEIKPKLWVFFGHTGKYEAELVHASEDYDMAILKVARPSPRHFALSQNAPEAIPKLDAVWSIGYPAIDREPLTQKELFEKFVNQKARGPVQSKFPESAFEISKRDGSITKRAERKNMGEGEQESFVIQHSAQIFGGNSGGPLITRTGQVIGINTWGRSKALLDSSGKVIGKAEININYALTLPQLRAEIEKHIPGVAWQALSEE